MCEKCAYLFPKGDLSKQCSVCQEDKYKKHRGKKKPKRVAWLWDIAQQLKMRLSWRGFEQKLEPIPKTAHEDCAPTVASSPLIPDKIRQTINVTTKTRIGAYSFLLALACDGFQPWRGVQYTMWFLALRILNFTQQHIASVSFFCLHLFVVVVTIVILLDIMCGCVVMVGSGAYHHWDHQWPQGTGNIAVLC